MTFLQMDAILKRLRAGVVMLSPGEQRAIMNYLVDQVDELKRQVESLRGSELTQRSEESDTNGRVRRGRKPNKDEGEISPSSGND